MASRQVLAERLLATGEGIRQHKMMGRYRDDDIHSPVAMNDIGVMIARFTRRALILREERLAS